MKEIFERLDRLCAELAGQQLRRDDWWKPELASIKERIADVLVERRAGADRRAALRIPIVKG